MGDDVEHSVMALLRDLDAKLDQVHTRLDQLTDRVAGLELVQGSIHRELTALADSEAQVRASLERLSDRSDWMELTNP